MPTKRNQRRNAQPAPKPADSAPRQMPLGEEEAEVRMPSKWVRLLKRIGLAALLVLALIFAYLFLLLGEPDDDAKYMGDVQEETITMPMSALEIPGEANVDMLAEAFGQPVLSVGEALEMQKARIYDTAFEGGYARRVTLTYAFADGTPVTVESLRPTAAVSLLKGSGYRLDADTLYTLGGLNAARMDNATTCCVFAQSDTAVYAVICPQGRAEELAALLRYTTLTAPNPQQEE